MTACTLAFIAKSAYAGEQWSHSYSGQNSSIFPQSRQSQEHNHANPELLQAALQIQLSKERMHADQLNNQRDVHKITCETYRQTQQNLITAQCEIQSKACEAVVEVDKSKNAQMTNLINETFNAIKEIIGNVLDENEVHDTLEDHFNKFSEEENDQIRSADHEHDFDETKETNNCNEHNQGSGSGQMAGGIGMGPVAVGGRTSARGHMNVKSNRSNSEHGVRNQNHHLEQDEQRNNRVNDLQKELLKQYKERNTKTLTDAQVGRLSRTISQFVSVASRSSNASHAVSVAAINETTKTSTEAVMKAQEGATQIFQQAVTQTAAVSATFNNPMDMAATASLTSLLSLSPIGNTRQIPQLRGHQSSQQGSEDKLKNRYDDL